MQRKIRGEYILVRSMAASLPPTIFPCILHLLLDVALGFNRIYKSRGLTKRHSSLSQFGLPVMLALLISGCGNDLSDLNALLEQSIHENAVTIEVQAQLTAEQVVSLAPVTTDSEGSAQFVINLESNAITGQVIIQQQQNLPVQQVQIRQGFGGRNGNPVLDLQPDPFDPNIWQVPDNHLLGNADVELLLRGGLHILIITDTHASGELRGQLLLGGQELLINPLGADQLLNIGSNSGAASAISYLSVDFITGEIQGCVRRLGDTLPDEVALHAGLAGLDGAEILRYQEDAAEAGVWHSPENTVLPTETLQQLEAAQLYVQAGGAGYPDGAIRGQLYLPHYLLKVTGLSGLNLIPPVNSAATGKAFFTVNAFDGTAQAIVRVTGMSPTDVALFRVNNPNSTENGHLLFTLEEHGDYWRLPSGSVFGNNDFNDIGKDRLIFIATTAGFPAGEIGGRI